MHDSKCPLLVLLLLTATAGCSSAPKQDAEAPSGIPAWVKAAPRYTAGGRIVFIGEGEDRAQANATTKSIAMALQDLANECSFIPKETKANPQHLDETAGIIYRSYAMVSIGQDECDRARKTFDPAEIRASADPALSAQVENYRAVYDPAEPEEEAKVPSSLDLPAFFVARQQIARAKASAALGHEVDATKLATASALAKNTAIFASTYAQPLAGALAFSNQRPKWIDHQASAVRDTIAERARIQKEHPYTAPPASPAPGQSNGRGKGGRRRGGQPAQNPSSSSGGEPASNGNL